MCYYEGGYEWHSSIGLYAGRNRRLYQNITKCIFVINACNDIDLAIDREKTKYKEGRHRGMIANEHMTVGIK